MSRPQLSIVITLHADAHAAERLLDEVLAVAEGLDRSLELVLVDDGVDVALHDLVRRRAAADPRVVPVRLSRGFGAEAALHAGLRAAHGDGVIVMHADGRHPPAVLPELVARWDEGARVVHGVRDRPAAETTTERVVTWPFLELLSRATGRDFHRESAFKLLDRVAVDAVVDLPERARSFRALAAWVGFPTAEVSFRAAPRVAQPRAPALSAADELVATTSLPLRLISGVGFAVLFGGFLLGLLALWNWAIGVAVTGFTTTILAVVIVGGANLLSIGVLSLYVAAIFEEVKARPTYLLRAEPRPRS